MKYTIMVFIAVALSITAKAQTINSNQVPTPINSTFSSQFGKADNMKWEQYGDNYSVRFGMNGNHHTALFDPTGKWLETGTELQTNQIPSTVNQTLSKQYVGYSVSQVNSLKQNEGDMIYQVHLMKGTEEKDIYLNEKGETTVRKYSTMEKMPKKQ